MKNKKLLVSALLGVSTLAIGAVVGVAAGKKSGFRAYADPVEPEWHHYHAQNPSLDGHGKATSRGTKEYWVQCGGAYQMNEPQSGNKVYEAGAPSTAEFTEDDPRWSTYCEIHGHSFDAFSVCEHCNEIQIKTKVANKAVAGASAVNEEAPLGFSNVFTVTGLTNGYNGESFDIQNYDALYFSLYHDIGYVYVFGGGATNPIMWQGDWYNFLLIREAGSFVAHYKKAYETSWNTDRFSIDGATDQNFSSLLRLYNDGGNLPTANVKCTEVYAAKLAESVNAADVTDASIKTFQTNKQVRRVEQQDAWKAPVGSASDEAGHGEYYNVGGRDVIHLSAHYTSFDANRFNYNSGWSEWRFTHSTTTGINSVTFTYLYTDSNSDASNDGVGNAHTMCQWYNDGVKIGGDSKYIGAAMPLVNDGEWHTINVPANGSFDITHFVMKIFHFTGDIYISNLVYVEGVADLDEANVTDLSIKEFQTNKQVRRVEQQDAWKAPVGSASDEAGHSEYHTVGGKQAIRLSAYYDAVTDSNRYNYNSGWSEFRFVHPVTGVNSVTFEYLYFDSNSDASNDGVGNAHTMCQWYNDNVKIGGDSKYIGAAMPLVNDGTWRSITVSADGSFDITHFVMKIFHFTGEVFISNLVYA